MAINEKLFKEEVLGGGGPLQVYTRQSMKSFLRQMNYHGFVKMQGDGERSASLPEFLAEEAAASAHSKVEPSLRTSSNAHGGLGGGTDLRIA